MRRTGIVLVVCFASFAAACQDRASEAKKPGDSPPPPQSKNVTRVFSLQDGTSSFLYIQDGAGTPRRLTTRKTGWEMDGVLSPKGDVVAYAVSDGPEAKSEVWVSRIDGSHAHRVSAADDDATRPAFGPDGAFLLYAKSRFNGHYSPIARPRRHEFDVVKVTVDPDRSVAGAAPVDLTQQGFFDCRSLSISSDGERFLVSTSGYPIGDLIEEFEIASPLKIKRIFQPHVPGEPSGGPAFGQAAYTKDGMGIVFTAASQEKGRNFDYNIYQMSAITGGDLVQLTHLAGMIDGMSVGADGTVVFSNGGQLYALDPNTRELQHD